MFFQNNDEKVGLDEYTETLRRLVDNNTEEAIKFLFRVYDADGKKLPGLETSSDLDFYFLTQMYLKTCFYLWNTGLTMRFQFYVFDPPTPTPTPYFIWKFFFKLVLPRKRQFRHQLTKESLQLVIKRNRHSETSKIEGLAQIYALVP